jgi:hypothetical protein
MVSKTVEVASSAESAEQGHPLVFVVTYLPLKSWMKIIPFIRLSGKVEKQLRSSQGLIRYFHVVNLNTISKVSTDCAWTFSISTGADLR